MFLFISGPRLLFLYSRRSSSLNLIKGEHVPPWASHFLRVRKPKAWPSCSQIQSADGIWSCPGINHYQIVISGKYLGWYNIIKRWCLIWSLPQCFYVNILHSWQRNRVWESLRNSPTVILDRGRRRRRMLVDVALKSTLTLQRWLWIQHWATSA